MVAGNRRLEFKAEPKRAASPGTDVLTFLFNVLAVSIASQVLVCRITCLHSICKLCWIISAGNAQSFKKRGTK